MVGRAYRLRLRRRLKVGKQQAADMGLQAERKVDRYFFRRLERIVPVGRFVAVWVALLFFLAGGVVVQALNLSTYYEFLKPAPGGVHTEGMVGGFTTANPLYATNQADMSVTRLVFSSLLTYNENGELVGDLAKSWHVSESETEYTVTLRDDAMWHDGQPVVAKDVVFTYKTIQKPDAQSPLFGGWQNITVTQKDAKTVVFALSNPLSSFLHSLTNGIVPEHVLKDIKPVNLRTASFNTVNPVGSGPFKWRSVEVRGSAQQNREERIALEGYDDYYGGAPKLDGFVLRVFQNKDRLISEFKNLQVDAMAGLDEVPESLLNDSSVVTYSLPLKAQVMTYFKTSSGVLASTKVRQALVHAANPQEIISSLSYPTIPVTEPVLRSQLGYDPALQQLPFNQAEAKTLLDSDGWIVGKNGIRVKNNVPLSFNLHAKNIPEFTRATTLLQKQWRTVGVDAKLVLQDDTEFEGTLSGHAYDALLYGISVGEDPDVYAYWHSSQADVRSVNWLNFSEYKSDVADDAISAGRTRTDSELRAIKYKPFLEAWRADAPALGLYQPRYLYISHGQVYGLEEHPINSQVERFSNVTDWMTQRARASE
ncbi:MAG: ABC transporter substrate-binding protein [Candidatus Saccharimonadales bacterium]